jgi:hypothetical protein
LAVGYKVLLGLILGPAEQGQPPIVFCMRESKILEKIFGFMPKITRRAINVA